MTSMQCINIVGRQHIYACVASDMLNCIIFPGTVSFTLKKIFPFLIISGKKSIVKLLGMNKTLVSDGKESTELEDV